MCWIYRNIYIVYRYGCEYRYIDVKMVLDLGKGSMK